MVRIARPTSLAIWHRGRSDRRPNRSGRPNCRQFASLDLKKHPDFSHRRPTSQDFRRLLFWHFPVISDQLKRMCFRIASEKKVARFESHRTSRLHRAIWATKSKKLVQNMFSERQRHINFFHINFLSRPSSPGLSRGQTGDKPGEIGLSLCKIRRKPRFVPGFHRICPRDKPGEIPGTNPGLSQDQPDKKVYVYVPFACLNVRIC